MKNEEAKDKPRAAYAAPTLTLHGKMASLTAGGTAQAFEQAEAMGKLGNQD